MTGYASKRQAAWAKFSDPWLGIAGWKDPEPEPEPQGGPLYEPLAVEKQDTLKLALEKAKADCDKATADWVKASADCDKANADWAKAYVDWAKAKADWAKAKPDCDKAYVDWAKAKAEIKRIENLLEKQDDQTT